MIRNQRLSHRDVSPILGYLILGAFTYVVYGSALIAAIGTGWIVAVVIALILVGITAELFLDWRHDRAPRTLERRFEIPTDPLSFVSVLAGTVLTYFLSVDVGLGAVVASALVGVVAAAVVKAYAAPVFCGSFVGMAAAEVLSFGTVALAGVFAGIVFVVAKDVLNGYGGKLGTIAFAGSFAAASAVGLPLTTGIVPVWDVGRLLLAYCAAGAFVTFLLNENFENGPVMASGIVGLAAGLLLPVAHGPELGGFLAVGVFAASFAGMSGSSRFDRAAWMIPAGAVCALALMYSMPYMGGAGGKLGTIGFGAVLGIHGLARWVEGAATARNRRRAT